MDWFRSALILQESIVIVLFMIAAYRDWRWSSTTCDSRIKTIYKGRAYTSVGIVILCFGVMTAHIEKWGEDLTLRAPIAQVAMIFLLLGWFYAFQRHYLNIDG